MTRDDFQSLCRSCFILFTNTARLDTVRLSCVLWSKFSFLVSYGRLPANARLQWRRIRWCDTEVASNLGSVCHTPEFSTSRPESCPICDTPEFPTTPSQEVDVAGCICIGQGNLMKDLWSSSTDTPVCERRCPSPAETILYDDDLHRVEDRRSGPTPKCPAQDRLKGTRKNFLGTESPTRTSFPSDFWRRLAVAPLST